MNNKGLEIDIKGELQDDSYGYQLECKHGIWWLSLYNEGIEPVEDYEYETEQAALEDIAEVNKGGEINLWDNTSGIEKLWDRLFKKKK